MLAYHNDPQIKSDALAAIKAHREADNLIQGHGYWKDGKGCAIGCQIQSGDHMEYESRFGITVHLARLEDCIFEGLPVEEARKWPERFMSAIPVGAELSRVHWQLLHWLLTDASVNPGIAHPLVSAAVHTCADLIEILADGGVVSGSAARSAESAAWSAARSAACAAWSAASAASAARSAAWSAAESAAWSAESAASAAESAAWSAACSAARSAAASARSAESAAYVKIADKLIALIESCEASGK